MKTIEQISAEIQSKLQNDFAKIDNICLNNSQKVLEAFRNHKIALRHFSQTTGYGYGDEGRDTLGKLFATIFGTEDAIVSSHLLSGTHAISTVLYGILRPNDLALSITGEPYDTLREIISKKNSGSLTDFNIKFEQIDLIDGKFDLENIKTQIIEKKPKMIFMQRSRGYSARNPLSIADIENIVKFIRNIDKNVVIFCDNCYGEFCEEQEPTNVGVDIVAGSLIKNIGGGIAQSGGYFAGKSDLVNLCANRLTTPSTGAEIGSNAAGYQSYYQGLFLAPHTTAQALKGALFLGEMMKYVGFKLIPDKCEDCFDIIRAIEFETAEQLIQFVRLVQKYSPVDSYVTPYPWDMPGYTDQVIMAAGCFVQGSSIELSCDAPIRAPYIAYCQGGLTYEHVIIVAQKIAEYFLK